jgi:hypothetical protein
MRTPRDPFWEAVGILEQLRHARPVCNSCGMATFHRFDCPLGEYDRKRARARRRMIDRARRDWFNENAMKSDQYSNRHA